MRRGRAARPSRSGPLARRAFHDEAGQAGGLEALAFGVLVFVMGTLLVAGAWGVVDAKVAASEAARDAARALVQAPPGEGPSRAAAAAAAAIAASGRSPRNMTLAIEGTPARCRRVSVTVGYRVPLVRVPLVGAGVGAVTVSDTASELVDPYGSGLPGAAQCRYP